MDKPNTSIELTVIIKDEERTYKQKFLVYEPITFAEYDPIVKKCMDEAMQGFQGEPEDVVVKASMTFK